MPAKPTLLPRPVRRPEPDDDPRAALVERRPVIAMLSDAHFARLAARARREHCHPTLLLSRLLGEWLERGG